MSKKENTKKEKVEEYEFSNIKECADTYQPREQEPDYKDLYLRTLADMDNLRKNTSKRISEIYSSANEKLISEMLPYLDALDLAIVHEKQNGSGYEVLKKQFVNILERFGVKEIVVNQYDAFDANTMNAIMTIQTEDETKHNTIYEIAKKGYTLNDNVIRYADVVVYMYNKN